MYSAPLMSSPGHQAAGLLYSHLGGTMPVIERRDPETRRLLERMPHTEFMRILLEDARTCRRACSIMRDVLAGGVFMYAGSRWGVEKELEERNE